MIPQIPRIYELPRTIGVEAHQKRSFDLIGNMYNSLLRKKDDLIREALIKNGFNPYNTTFLIDNFQLVEVDGAPFEHLYFRHGRPDQKRIISFSKPETTETNQDIVTGVCTVNISINYY